MSNGYIGPYSPEAYASGDPANYSDATDSTPTVTVPWYVGLSDVLSGIGAAARGVAQGVVQVQQGVVMDQWGRIVSVGGQPVYNYAPTGTLGGLVGGTSLTTLLLLGLGVLIVLKLLK